MKTTASAVAQKQAPGLTSKESALCRGGVSTETTGGVLGGPPLPNCRTEARLPELEVRWEGDTRGRPKMETGQYPLSYHKKWGWRKVRKHEKCPDSKDEVSRALCLGTGSAEEGRAVCWRSGSEWGVYWWGASQEAKIKFTDTKSRTGTEIVAWDVGAGIWGITVWSAWSFNLGWWQQFWNEWQWCLHNDVNVLNATDCTLNG